MLTVVFATHNGERTLNQVLEACERLDPPPGGWRLVVVDNASTDRTRDLLADRVRAGRLPIRVLAETGRGKNRALNRALDEVDGDLVVFTDDDVLPEPGWLVALRAAADAHPDHAIFGGTIRPAFLAPPPPWLVGSGAPQGVLYAVTDCAEGACPADAVWGPNMAIRREVFARGFRFDPAVGPGVGAQYPMGSETEFTTRLERHGHRAWFVERAVVRHLVRPAQMTETFVAGRAYRHGFGVCRYQPGLMASRWPRLQGVPLRLLPKILGWTAAAALARLLPASPLRLRAVYQGAWWLGAARSMHDRRHAASASVPERARSEAISS